MRSRLTESHPPRVVLVPRMTAVREPRFVAMNGGDLDPSIRTVDGAEQRAAGLRRLGPATAAR